MESITIIGTGGHAAAVVDALKGSPTFYVSGLLSETLPVGEKAFGLNIIGRPNDKTWLSQKTFIGIGDAKIRERMSRSDHVFINVIHPSANIGSVMCMGTFFGANSFVGTGAVVGNFAIINTGVILEHDSSVGNYSNLCPGVVTGGHVKIGNRTTIGLGSILRDGVTIGHNAVVGMGSVVTCDVPDNEVWFGSPAKFQRLNK